MHLFSRTFPAVGSVRLVSVSSSFFRLSVSVCLANSRKKNRYVFFFYELAPAISYATQFSNLLCVRPCSVSAPLFPDEV